MTDTNEQPPVPTWEEVARTYGRFLYSVAFRLTFRAPERTLRDAEIDSIESRMLAALGSELGIHRRDAGSGEATGERA